MRARLRASWFLITGVVLTMLMSCGKPAQNAQISGVPNSVPDLSGTWILNRDDSDNPRDRAREGRSSRGGRGGRGGGMGGITGGRGGRVGGRDQNSGNPGAALRMLLAGAERLTISQSDSTIDIANAAGEITVIRADGRRRDLEAVGRGERVRIKAQWEDGRLVVERESDDWGRITETYELVSSSERLVVNTRLRMRGASRTLEFQRVYDAEPETE